MYLFDVHEDDLLVGLLDAHNGPDKVLPEHVEHLHVVGLGLQQLLQDEVPLFLRLHALDLCVELLVAGVERAKIFVNVLLFLCAIVA